MKNPRKQLNKIIVHPSFKKTIEEIKNSNMQVLQKPTIVESDFSDRMFPSVGNLREIEHELKYNLDAKKGEEFSKKQFWGGYDESKLNFVALEGMAFFTSHSLVISDKKEYTPLNYLTFYFYTKAKKLSETSEFIKYTENAVEASNLDYVVDRATILTEHDVDNIILFIDGPLVGGNMTSYTLDLVEKLHKKGIIPIFFVKNSDSNLVINNTESLINGFNSDMHWSHHILKPGQRTRFYLYADAYNPRNAKIFCYLKAFNLSPQRIEMHTDTYELCKDNLNNVLDLIYYLILVHGDLKNPQIRPIAIAEMYARESLRLIDPFKIFRSIGLVPSMNEIRFGGV